MKTFSCVCDRKGFKSKTREVKTDQVQSKNYWVEVWVVQAECCETLHDVQMALWQFHKTASFMFIEIKATLNLLAILLHTFLLWGTVIFLFSLFVSTLLASDHSRGVFQHTKTWQNKKENRKKMVTQALPNRPFYFKAPCLPLWHISLSITQLWFQRLKIFPEMAAETAGKDGSGRRGDSERSAPTGFFFMLWLQVSLMKRQKRDEKQWDATCRLH